MFSNARSYLAAILLVILAAPAFAQNRRNPERENVELSGTLKDMRGNVLQIEATDGEAWLVQIAPRADKVLYAGTAEPNWIRPGMWVRFRGNFNQKLQSDEPVTELTVFTPTDEVELGIIPEKSLGGNLFSDEPEPEEVDKNAHIPCSVAGRIAAIKKNKMTVAAGRAAVTVEVVDDVRIAVEVADLSVAQPGDQVEIRGWKYAMVPGRAMAGQVTITGDKPLTAAKPKRGKQKADEKKKQDEDKDADEPQDEKEKEEPSDDENG